MAHMERTVQRIAEAHGIAFKIRGHAPCGIVTGKIGACAVACLVRILHHGALTGGTASTKAVIGDPELGKVSFECRSSRHAELFQIPAIIRLLQQEFAGFLVLDLEVLDIESKVSELRLEFRVVPRTILGDVFRERLDGKREPGLVLVGTKQKRNGKLRRILVFGI